MAENDSTNNLAEMNVGDIYDDLRKRLLQVRGIVDLIGNYDPDNVDDGSLSDATWAAKELLAQAAELASQLLQAKTAAEV